jgi:hypothetical protein
MSSKDSYHVLLSCASRSDADYFSNLLRAHADGASIRTREVGTLPELRERLADPPGRCWSRPTAKRNCLQRMC